MVYHFELWPQDLLANYLPLSLALGCWLCRALAHGCCEQSELAGPWANELVNLVNLSELGELVDYRTCGSPLFTLSKTLCKLGILQDRNCSLRWQHEVPPINDLVIQTLVLLRRNTPLPVPNNTLVSTCCTTPIAKRCSWPGNCEAQRNSTAWHSQIGESPAWTWNFQSSGSYGNVDKKLSMPLIE